MTDEDTGTSASTVPTNSQSRAKCAVRDDGDKDQNGQEERLDRSPMSELSSSANTELSTIKLWLIACGMTFTLFLGVSTLGQQYRLIPPRRHLLMAFAHVPQTFASTSTALMIPEIARTLNTSELAAQWVVSAYFLAFAWSVTPRRYRLA